MAPCCDQKPLPEECGDEYDAWYDAYQEAWPDYEDDYDGWLNRYLETTAQDSQLQAVHFGGSLAQALRGNVPVSSFSSLGNFNLGLSDAEETTLVDHVLPIYEQAANPATSLRQQVQDFGQLTRRGLHLARDRYERRRVHELGHVEPRADV